MAARVQVVEVSSVGELDAAISSWVIQGFVLANKTENSATMVKKKEFSVLWAVIGIVLCVIPLLIYLIVYASESDKVVEIRVTGAAKDPLVEIERLQALRDRNVISDEEFEAEKKKLLG